MKKKIAIIGANSYIARNVIYFLRQTPELYELTLYDRRDSQVDGLENYISFDVLSKESLKNINFDVDIVFVFVGKTGSMNGFDDPDIFIDINERSMLNILNEYRLQKSLAKIIFPSTRLVYKGGGDKLKEDDEKEFNTLYAINKYACEQYLEMYSRIYGIKYCVFRICLPYGTLILNASSYGTAEFMLSKATKGENITLYGDGSARRTITYIGYLCNVMVNGALSDKCINDVFNVGGENYSLLEMATLISEKYGVKVEFIQWPESALKIESGDTVFNSEKLDCVLKINNNTTFSEWIKKENV